MHRVGARLGRMDRDVGGNTGQDLVTRDQQLQIGAVQASVLGRMARADDNAPSVGANPDFFAILDAAIALRQGMDVFAKVAETGLVVFNGPTAPVSYTHLRAH